MLSSKKYDLPFDLRPYQEEGVKFLSGNDCALIADEMGLGKTVQTIIAIRNTMQKHGMRKVLIVVPSALKSNWLKEFEIWGGIIPKIVSGKKEKRIQMFKSRIPILLTTYEIIREDIDLIKHTTEFDLIVLDEAQRIKNSTSNTARSIKLLRKNFAWALTGTPVENSPEDIASIFNFLKFGLLTKDDSIPEIKNTIHPYFLRRKKSEVFEDLPEKIEQELYLDLSINQRLSYEETQSERMKLISQSSEKEKISNILALITELKKICNFDPITKESAKLDRVKNIVQEKFSSGEKVILFSQYVESLKEIKESLVDIDTEIYHGSLKEDEKDSVLERFKSSASPKLLLMSLRAGGVGLNLPEASTVILFDRWWNPALEEQAVARADRFGRKNILHVFKFIVSNSVEERIDELLKQKESLFEDIVEGTAEIVKKLSLKEITNILE